MMMTPIDIRYLHDLMFYARRDQLPIVTECPECGDQIPEYDQSTMGSDLRRFEEIHTLIDLRAEGDLRPIPTIVIGCEGYHIMDEAGREKDHEFHEEFETIGDALRADLGLPPADL